jgi:hypothetical protein
VPKDAKKNLHDVILNDGLHLQGPGLIPPNSRLQVGLDEHFREYQGLYVREPYPLRRLHAEPILHHPRYVTGYAFKAVLRGRASLDDVLILPQALSEVIDSRGREHDGVQLGSPQAGRYQGFAASSGASSILPDRR